MSDALAIPALPSPAPVFNCPGCGNWLPPGTLACPDCHAILYADHLRTLASAASSEESAGHWPQARDTWQQALAWLPPETSQYTGIQQRIAQIEARLQAADNRKATWTRRLGPFAPILVFLSKFKTLLLFASKAKFLLSFALFFGMYAGFYGWRFGLGFSVSILLHEMGHYIAAKRRGLKVDLPVFFPGLGAYVRWYSQGISLEDLSGIALAGPFVGLIVAAAFGLTSHLLHEPPSRGLFSALAHFTALLNLLNLIPVLGLDGAQATYALNRTQRLLVAATALIFFGLLGASQGIIYLPIALCMFYRVFTRDYPEEPSTRTLIHFMLLLFTLGALEYLFPASATLLRR